MAREVKLMFPPPFEVFCDLLMQGPMETQNIIKERCFFRLVTRVGQRKNSESPQEIKPQTFRFCALILYLSHRDSTVSKVYYKVCKTHVLHTARISNVNNIMFVDGNKRDGDKRDKILLFYIIKKPKLLIVMSSMCLLSEIICKNQSKYVRNSAHFKNAEKQIVKWCQNGG